MDSNGYNDSIFPTEQGSCYICGKGGDTARHEAYFGANRTICKREGMWLYLCPECHNIVHLKPDGGEMDRYIKKECFHRYCETHSREEFFRLIGKYYD